MNEAVLEIRRYTGEVEHHRHPYHQVILPVSGALEIDLGHRSGRVAASTGAFVSAGCRHAFSAGRSDSFVVLDLPAASVAWARPDDVPEFFPIGREVCGLIDYVTAPGAPRTLAAPLRDAWIRLLMDRIAPGDRPDRTELAVRRALVFMEASLASPIRVADIAEAAGVSATRLHDAFVRRRGTTPHARLVALRLDAAERMLADPRLSVAAVALLTGHADQSALTRIMRRERSDTPAALRRRLGGGRKSPETGRIGQDPGPARA